MAIDGELSEGKANKRIIEVLIVVFVVIVAAYVFYDFNGHSFKVSDRQVLLIVSDSMDGDVTEFDIDSFPKNTMVMVEHLSEDEMMELQVGDVISFKYGSILDHHRITELHLESGYVVTKGDNFEKYHSEETVHFSDINGKVVGTSHALGVLTSFVKEHYIIVIAAIAVLAIAAELIGSRLKSEKGDE